MTMDEIRASRKEFLTPKDIAPVLGCAQYSINVQVAEDIEKGANSLGFAIIKIGTRVKIPRLAFIAYMEGRNNG